MVRSGISVVIGIGRAAVVGIGRAGVVAVVAGTVVVAGGARTIVIAAVATVVVVVIAVVGAARIGSATTWGRTDPRDTVRTGSPAVEIVDIGSIAMEGQVLVVTITTT